ncbi:hypothetical protein AB0392_18135 [Nonomuraea angiospora]|uniref:hypothetical protein n=1 Tax=Nonomuraea angiospora TaxID=46172 RepID=UPI003450E01E
MMSQIIDILKELIAALAEAIKNAHKWVKVLLAAALVCALVGFGIFWGFRLARPSVNLGGVDLADSCKLLKYETNDLDSCSSRIDLQAACNWQYDRTDLIFRFSSDSPESGMCYVSTDLERVGGIKNMQGYCRHAYSPSTIVEATKVNNVWTCREAIDMKLACRVLYRLDGVEARNENGVWHCYQIA